MKKIFIVTLSCLIIGVTGAQAHGNPHHGPVGHHGVPVHYVGGHHHTNHVTVRHVNHHHGNYAYHHRHHPSHSSIYVSDGLGLAMVTLGTVALVANLLND